MRTLHFNAGEVVFEEGSASDCAYLVEGGKFEVSRIHQGQKQILGTVKEKEIFGEMGLIDGQPRSATITAIEKSSVSQITQDCFNSMERTSSEALIPLLRVLTARIRDSYKLATMSQSSTL